MEPAELEALMNPQPVVQQGDEGGGSTEAEPEHAVTFSKPVKAGKAGKAGKGKKVPVVTAAPARKKSGKDMSAPELEWQKKAINASIAGCVQKCLLMSSLFSASSGLACNVSSQRPPRRVKRAAGMFDTSRLRRLRWCVRVMCRNRVLSCRDFAHHVFTSRGAHTPVFTPYLAALRLGGIA